MTQEDTGLSEVMNASVYYVLALTGDPPSDRARQTASEHAQNCNYYQYQSDGCYHQVESVGGVTVLYPPQQGPLRYVCLRHITNITGLRFCPPPKQAVDTGVTLYSAVAGPEAATDVLPDTFIASVVEADPFPTVVVPVSATGSRGLVLLFQEISSGNSAAQKSRCRWLRATFDPEIKGSVS